MVVYFILFSLTNYRVKIENIWKKLEPKGMDIKNPLKVYATVCFKFSAIEPNQREKQISISTFLHWKLPL